MSDDGCNSNLPILPYGSDKLQKWYDFQVYKESDFTLVTYKTGK